MIGRIILSIVWTGVLSMVIYGLCDTILPLFSKIKLKGKLIAFLIILFGVQVFRMCIEDIIDYRDAKMELIESIEYNGGELYINGKKEDILVAYGNSKMPCDMIIRCKKMNNTIIPGLFNGSETAAVVVARDEIFNSIRNYVPGTIDNDKFFKGTSVALKEASKLDYRSSILISTGEVPIDNTVAVKANSDNSLSEINSKLEKLQSDVNELKNREINSEEKSRVVLNVVLVIASIWLMILMTYIVIVKINAKTKIDLITTSSDAKIREGVMLESRDTK